MSPRVLVQVWCEIDPTLNVRIDRQMGNPIADEGDLLTRVSPLGRLGVFEALRLDGVHVTAFALGDNAADALRHALAAGAERALALLFSGADAEPFSLGALAGWFQREQPNLIIADRWTGLLAARLGWSHLAGLSDLRIEAGRLHAVRHLGRGERELVTAQPPAALRLQTEIVKPPYVSRARIQAIAESRIERVELSAEPESNVAEVGPVQLARARVRMGKTAAPAGASANDRLQALMGLAGAKPSTTPRREGKASPTPDEMAEEFVRYLAHHQLLPNVDQNSG